MSGPHPAVASARSAVRAALADVPAASSVLVACSGGPDSLALAAATAFVAPRLGLRAGAVCVDHGLQPGSAEAAARAAATCGRLGLEPAWTERVEVDGRAGGPEAAARAARLAALEAAAERTGAVAVLLGHTMDDQAETVLLRLARGSGARALAGMAAVRGLVRRPFLGLRRAQTRTVCDVLGLQPWDDPTNADVAAQRRAAVRHEILPALERVLGPGVVPALARSAALLRADADHLDALANQLLDRAVVARSPEGLDLDPAPLAEAPAAVRGRCLRAAALAAGCPAGALAEVHVQALAALVLAWRGQGPIDLPGGVVAGRACGRLWLRAGRGAGGTCQCQSETR